MTLADRSKWFRTARPSPDAPLRLFCFPWAGGGASAFARWGASLEGIAEVCAVQLPGREDRLREAPLRYMKGAAAEVAALVATEKPLAFFGHSSGALLAFETARQMIESQKTAPVRLFVSASRPPNGKPAKVRHTLHDEDLFEEIRSLSGTAAAVLAEPDLMALFLPLFRADFEMAETYRHRSNDPLDVPLSIYGGRGDEEASEADLSGWRGMTSADVRMRMFDGGHFYVRTAQDQVLRAIAEELRAP